MSLVEPAPTNTQVTYTPIPVNDLEIMHFKDGSVHLCADKYIRLTPLQWALWQMIDGRTSLEELFFRLGNDPRKNVMVVQFVQQMARLGFVSNFPDETGQLEPQDAGRFANFIKMLPRILHPRISFPIPASISVWLYNRLFRFLFNKPMLILVLATVIWAIVSYTRREAVHNLLFLGVFEGSLMLGGVAVPKLAMTYVMIFVIAAIHELGHAMAATRYGRPIREAGVGLIALIFLASFVRMKDTWLLPTRKRLTILLCGGIFSGALGSIMVFLGLAAGNAPLAMYIRDLGMFTISATIINFYPFLFRTDGYYIVEDLVNIPALRSKAWRQVAARVRGHHQIATAGRRSQYWLYAYVVLQVLSYASFLLLAF